MEVENINICEEQVIDIAKIAANQMTDCPLTRQEAIQSLLAEIVQAEKVVNKSLKSTEARIFYMTAQGKICKCSNEVLNTYLCICNRLKMLRSLFKYMKVTAKQL